MQIQEFCAETTLSRKQVRHLEKQGWLPQEQKGQYNKKHVQCIQIVQKLQDQGMDRLQIQKEIQAFWNNKRVFFSKTETVGVVVKPMGSSEITIPDILAISEPTVFNSFVASAFFKWGWKIVFGMGVVLESFYWLETLGDWIKR